MKQLVSIVVLFFCVLNGSSQFQNVMISDVFNPTEPVIIMDNNQPDYLVVGASLNSYFISIDTGITWTQSQLISDLGVIGNPVVLVDDESNYFYFHLSNPYAFYPDGDTLDRIVCQKSINNGFSWTNGTYFGLDGAKDNTKEWAVVDLSNDYMYATWTQYDDFESIDPNDSSKILFTKSMDHGLTWSEPLRINQQNGNCADSDSTVKGASPAVGPNGEVYVTWAGPDGIIFNRSLDEGDTWLSENILIDSLVGGWNYNIPGLDRCNGFPITKCDRSLSEFNGNIYVNWSDQRNGVEDTDIWMSKSSDGGETWSDAIRVNNDGIGKHQFLTWMDIDQSNGHIYIVFYDRRNHEDDYTDVYMARSIDGGESFTNMLLSDSAFLAVDTMEFGDYINIAANNGIVRPVWTRFENGVFSIWTALVDYSIWSGIEETKNSSRSTFNAFPNPTKDKLNIHFDLKENAQITLQLFDASARLITTSISNENYGLGEHTFYLDKNDLNLKPGFYLLRLKVDEEYLSKRILIE